MKREITITRCGGVAACNCCNAYNWRGEPVMAGCYEPDIYAVTLGPVATYLCPNCLRTLRAAVDVTLDSRREDGDAG